MGKVGARAKCLDIISKATGKCKRFAKKKSPVFMKISYYFLKFLYNGRFL